MSDGEEDIVVDEGGEQVEEVVTETKSSMNVQDALKEVLSLSMRYDGLARGLKECARALDRREAHLAVLSESCDEEQIKKLVEALCNEHKIPLIKVSDSKKLGEWAGLCVIDREGNARKVVGASCVVVKDWGQESTGRSVILDIVQNQ